MSLDLLCNVIGLFGMALLLVAFFLLQSETLTSESPRYLLLNLVGSIALIVSLLRFWNLPVLVLECCWVAISIYGLLKSKRIMMKQERHE